MDGASELRISDWGSQIKEKDLNTKSKKFKETKEILFEELAFLISRPHFLLFKYQYFLKI